MSIKPGVLCKVISGVLHPSPNLNKIVEVVEYLGEHSLYGSIWKCKAKHNLITEYGVVSDSMDFAEIWLKPIPPETLHKEVLDEASV